MELNALSSNLATVRQQLEEGKRRVQEAEATAREKASKVEGEYIVYLVVWEYVLAWLVYHDLISHCNTVNCYFCTCRTEWAAEVTSGWAPSSIGKVSWVTIRSCVANFSYNHRLDTTNIGTGSWVRRSRSSLWWSKLLPCSTVFKSLRRHYRSSVGSIRHCR